MAASKPIGRPDSVDIENTDSSAADNTGSGVPDSALAEPVLGPPKQSGELGTLGPYRVLKKIGIGGMGAVYLGFDESLHRNVALKVMLPKVAANAAARERFLREARASAAVEHPNVVGIFSVGEHATVPYLAMQYLQGQPLDKYLAKKGTPGLAQILRVARETVDGLAAAHAKGLIHRDIKPANLWLEAPNGRIKILDFGLAKATGAENDNTEITHEGVAVGTPAYMAPEQARALPVDFRTDLFSLGAVLYRVCTGKQPFKGANMMAVLSALAADTPVPLRELNPAIPQSLADLIHKLLEKDPNNRPRNAMEVSAALKAIDKGLQGSGTLPQPLPQSGPLPFPMPAMMPQQYAPPQYMQIPSPHEDTFANLESGTPVEPVPAYRVKPITKLSPALQKSKQQPLAFIFCALAAVALLAGVVFLAFSKKAKVEPALEPESAKAIEKPKPAAAGPMKKFGSLLPIAESWIASTRKAPLVEQVRLVERELKARNKNFDGKLDYAAPAGIVTSVKLNADVVQDLTPLQGLAGLTSVSCSGTTAMSGQFFDLAPLEGLPIVALNVSLNYDLMDLNPLKGLPNLLVLNISGTGVIDLAPLSGRDFDSLNLSGCKIADIQPLAGGKYDALNLAGTGVSNLAPLSGCKIKDLHLNSEHITNLGPLIKCGLEKLRVEPATTKLKPAIFTALHDVLSLKEVQGLPAATFWLHNDGRSRSKIEPSRVLAAHTGEVAAAAYLDDGSQIVTAGKDNTVKVWDAALPAALRVITLPAPCFEVAFVPKTYLIATRDANTIRFWKPGSGEADGEAIKTSHDTGPFAFMPDGKRLLVAPSANANRIQTFDLAERKAGDSLETGPGSARRLAISLDGSAACVSGDASKMAVFDLATGKAAYQSSFPNTESCTAASFSKDGSRILFATEQGAVAIVDWKHGTEAAQFHTIPHTCASFAPGDKQIIIGTRDGWLDVLDAASGAPLHHANCGSFVKSIIPSPNGEKILTTHADGTVKEWDWKKLGRPE